MRRLMLVMSSLILSGLLVAPAGRAQDVSPFIGAWQNQLGSHLVVQSIAPSGAIAGHYVNHAAGTGCQGTMYPLTGWAYSSTITFAVLWDNAVANCNSQTAWAGVLANGKIATQWNLVTTRGQFLNGQDTFSPVVKTAHPSLLLDAKP